MFFRDEGPAGTRFEAICNPILLGYPDWAASAYVEYFNARDVRMPTIQRMRPGEVYVDDQDMAFANVVGTEIQADFYGPSNAGHGMAALLLREERRHAFLSFHRPLDAGGFAPEHGALVRDVTPHLIRALRLERQMAQARSLAAGLAMTLDHFGHPTFLLDAGGMILSMNRAAEAIVRLADTPLRVTQGRLSAVSAEADTRLRAAVADATRIALGGSASPPRVIRLPRADGGAQTLMLCPAPRGDVTGLASGPMVLAFAASGPASRPAVDILAAELGLTRAEARTAAALAQGHDPDAIAREHGVSRETVRTQLKTTMAKTGTSSQAQLVGLISRSLATLAGRSNG